MNNVSKNKYGSIMNKFFICLIIFSVSMSWATTKGKVYKNKNQVHVQTKENKVPSPIMDEELNPAKRPVQW